MQTETPEQGATVVVNYAQQCYEQVGQPGPDGTTPVGPNALILGPDPVPLICPNCNSVVVSDVKHAPNNRTHLIGLVFCVLLLWPCAICPYCIDDCQDSKHFCPHCEAYLGKFKRYEE